MASKVIEELAEVYQVLYLDPDKEDIESYKSILLKGEQAPSRDLSHFTGDERDVHETVETPAGPIEIVTLFNRSDFEVFIRDMMAAKSGPRDVIPKTMGASTLITFAEKDGNNRKRDRIKR